MIKFVNWLKNKKTYFLCASAILAAITGFLNDQITGVQMVQAIFAAVTAMTIRAGVSKVAKGQ